MGNVQRSGNYIKSLNEITTRVIQQNAQTCRVSASQIQSLIASGDCSIVIKNVDFSQLSGVDFTCLQQADLNAKILTQLKEQFDQMAKSLVSGIPFSIFNSQETTNWINLHNVLANEIMNQITQQCIVDTGQYQGFTCSGASSIYVENSTFSQIITSIFDCSQTSSTVAEVTNEIETFIKQVAISENKGLSFDLLFVALIIVAVVVVIVIMNKALDWKFLAIGLPVLAIIIFIVYLIIANKKNWWPFKSKFDDKNRKPDPPTPTPPPTQLELKIAQQAVDRYWGKLELGLNKPTLTPEQYRQLKYGDDQVAFDRPYSKRHVCKPKRGL